MNVYKLFEMYPYMLLQTFNQRRKCNMLNEIDLTRTLRNSLHIKLVKFY